ncbi:PIG-L family deacetylase [Undibacterium umbellatum]|uniref:PIG-L family deacetylase n=1 Tax=Undibacterium umbellatum TaxID=2762300 RepID=A0ABR6ZGS8_9BURK|nr:PIG-L family deacetylase [Undibacterium umbellatum]MBC3910941.1 PIG-L family deacetylase [Undibacterium umbellatum]
MNTVAQQKRAVFVVAHPDDFQLFMNPVAAAAILSGDYSVAIIVTTAGDGGQGPAYWAAREWGTIASVRWLLDCTPNAPFDETPSPAAGAPLWNFVSFNEHNITTWTANIAQTPCACYFMRLPDGNMCGEGFGVTGDVSLPQLSNSAITPQPFPSLATITTIGTVDGSTTYTSWNDFTTTLEAIITDNGNYAISDCWVNYQQTDQTTNPCDHYDHYATGLASNAAIGQSTPLAVSEYLDYAMTQPPNGKTQLQGSAALWKIGMMAAYDKQVYDCARGQQNGGGKICCTIGGDNLGVYAGWMMAAPVFTTSTPGNFSPPSLAPLWPPTPFYSGCSGCQCSSSDSTSDH